MKSQIAIERRLRTLRLRYAKKYIAVSQDRLPKNCVYNYEHRVNEVYTASKINEVDLAPHHSATLLVIQPDSPVVHLCLYGVDDPIHWNGDICDSDETARGCKFFKPRIAKQQALSEFTNLLQNDEFVYNNYRDIALLQWVLEDRVYKHALSWWEQLILWFKVMFVRTSKPLLQLPPGEVPEDLWSDSDDSSTDA